MARDFAGGTTTDRVEFATYSMADQMSVFCYFYADGVDATSRKLWTFYVASIPADLLILSWTSTSMRLVGKPTGTGGTWDLDSAPSTGAWHSLLVTYDRTSNSNNPTFYLDGSSVAFTEAFSPAGTKQVGSATVVIGNTLASSSLRCFDGKLAEFAWWNVILTAPEAASLGKGFSPPMIRPESLQGYAPLLGNASPEQDLIGGVSGTVTGATKADHPRIIRPRR